MSSVLSIDSDLKQALRLMESRLPKDVVNNVLLGYSLPDKEVIFKGCFPSNYRYPTAYGERLEEVDRLYSYLKKYESILEKEYKCERTNSKDTMEMEFFLSNLIGLVNEEILEGNHEGYDESKLLDTIKNCCDSDSVTEEGFEDMTYVDIISFLIRLVYVLTKSNHLIKYLAPVDIDEYRENIFGFFKRIISINIDRNDYGCRNTFSSLLRNFNYYLREGDIDFIYNIAEHIPYLLEEKEVVICCMKCCGCGYIVCEKGGCEFEEGCDSEEEYEDE